MGWKTLKSGTGTGWHEIDEEAGAGWHELIFESALDVGSACIDRNSTDGASNTIISKINPVNANGTLTKVCLYVNTAMTGLKVGIFYIVSGTTYKCRAATTIGNAGVGLNDNIEVSLTAVTGDFLGYYCSTGKIDRGTSAGSVHAYKYGDHCVVDSEEVYGEGSNCIFSLRGEG